MHKYSPIHVLEVRGREVGEDSGRVSESVIFSIEWECLLSFSFTSSSTWEAPLKLHTHTKNGNEICTQQKSLSSHDYKYCFLGD